VVEIGECMIQLRPSLQRGHARHDWLDTYHTFSFAQYFNPNQMGFRALRVINEDRIAVSGGFPDHSHDNMEIITFVISGSLEHKDSLGTGSIIAAGDVQHMSAGTGVTHSEFNPSSTDSVHLLQIWILPDKSDVTPVYNQVSLSSEQKLNKLHLVAGPVGINAPISIHQDAKFFATILEAKNNLNYEVSAGRGVWFQVITGAVSVNQTIAKAGDGLRIEDESLLAIKATESSEFLLFDLP